MISFQQTPGHGHLCSRQRPVEGAPLSDFSHVLKEPTVHDRQDDATEATDHGRFVLIEDFSTKFFWGTLFNLQTCSFG